MARSLRVGARVSVVRVSSSMKRPFLKVNSIRFDFVRIIFSSRFSSSIVVSNLDRVLGLGGLGTRNDSMTLAAPNRDNYDVS